MGYKKSPIPYMGNKYKILEYLIPNFPKHIDTFYDLFGGSGVVSGNIEDANQIVYNELNENIYNLVKLFKEYEPFEIINRIEEYVEEYHLANKSIDVRRELDDYDINKFEEAYLKFRDDYNKSRERCIYALYSNFL